MALNITFADFDTVCYSNQHNIIELIKHCVGIGIEVNINGAAIGNLENKVENVEQAAQEGHDALLLAKNLNERVSALETRVTAIWTNSTLFQSCPLGARIQDIEDKL